MALRMRVTSVIGGVRSSGSKVGVACFRGPQVLLYGLKPPDWPRKHGTQHPAHCRSIAAQDRYRYRSARNDALKPTLIPLLMFLGSLTLRVGMERHTNPKCERGLFA